MCFKTNPFSLFINLLFRQGKKSVIVKLLLTCFLKVRFMTNKPPSLAFNQALINISPIVGVFTNRNQIKPRVKIKLLSSRQRLVQGLRLLVLGALQTRSFFFTSLANEIVQASQKKGYAFKKSLELSMYLSTTIFRKL